MKLRKPIAEVLVCVAALALFVLKCTAQDVDDRKTETASVQTQQQLPVNWLYGAYVPKEVPLEPLSNERRWKLYVRQSYTTPGIYIKTGFFGVRDQIANVPSEWGDGGAGFAKRIGSRYAQFLIQNSFTSLGDAIAGWEPRYDRCRCSGFWPRTKHAFIRNFVTYNRTEKELRPQIFSYAAAFGGASLSAMWQPNNPNVVVKGYQGVISQAWVGVLVNWIGEFAPEFKRAIHHEKP